MKKQALLNVVGEGRIQLPADVAEIRLSVITEAKTAGEAAGSNAKLASSVVARLEELGVARSAMRTEGLSLYPVYTSDPQTGTSSIQSYRAEDTIAVRSAVDMAAKVFDAGIESGANHSSGITFGLADPEGHRQAALAAAVKSARTEAESVARAMGVEIEGPRTIDIDPPASGGTVSPRVLSRETSTPVLPGVISVTATVRVTFEVRAGKRKEASAKPASRKRAAQGA